MNMIEYVYILYTFIYIPGTQMTLLVWLEMTLFWRVWASKWRTNRFQVNTHINVRDTFKFYQVSLFVVSSSFFFLRWIVPSLPLVFPIIPMKPVLLSMSWALPKLWKTSRLREKTVPFIKLHRLWTKTATRIYSPENERNLPWKIVELWKTIPSPLF